MREWPQKARHLFTMTVAHPCPYIEGRLERDVVADLNIPNAQGFYDWLLRSGFRRVQHMAYRRPVRAATPVCLYGSMSTGFASAATCARFSAATAT